MKTNIYQQIEHNKDIEKIAFEVTKAKTEEVNEDEL